VAGDAGETKMIPGIVTALCAVSTPRFFETERGYQGELLAELRAALPALGLPGDTIVEQEYQKTLPVHKINITPDIIIHVPAAEGGNRNIGNSAVFELNFQAGPTEARGDFLNLDTVVGALDYPLGVFVNIDSARTEAAHYQGDYLGRIHFFAVRLIDGVVQVRHAYFTKDGLVER
jgi:hypothetical protein